MHSVRTAVFLVLVATLCTGCEAGKFGEVSGEIKYQGKVIDQGAITFVPVDGSGPSAGSAIVDGKYLARKVPVGDAKVRISGVKVTGKQKMYDDADSPFVQTSSEFMPAKYNSASEITYKVLPGEQKWNLDLPK